MGCTLFSSLGACMSPPRRTRVGFPGVSVGWGLAAPFATTFTSKGPQVVDGFSMALNLLSIGWIREGDSLLTMSGYPRDRTSADCGNNDSSRIRRVAIADVHWDSSFKRMSCTTTLQFCTNS